MLNMLHEMNNWMSVCGKTDIGELSFFEYFYNNESFEINELKNPCLKILLKLSPQRVYNVVYVDYRSLCLLQEFTAIHFQCV